MRKTLVIALCLTTAALSVTNRADESTAPDAPTVLLPRQAITPAQLAVIINELDPTSRRIGHYYAERRGIPSENLIRVPFAPGSPIMDPGEFEDLYAQVKAATPQGVQAYALAWTLPYRVGCLSITTAFAAGYDEAFCAEGCKPTRATRYFASESTRPYADYGIRPTMALAGDDFTAVKALIDRGVAADNSRPPGTGYLVKTHDKARSVRARGYAAAVEQLGNAVRLERIEADRIEQKPDVLFYFTGLTQVPGIDTNRYRPGAVADHLTSSGGQLNGTRQMSSLRWLEAGATGSYGTVVEPCNLLPKFPDPAILISSYLSGATLIEAYWKSVRMPGQGLFIGEPLARPFGGYELLQRSGRWVLRTFALIPGRYTLQGAAAPMGPYREITRFAKPGFEPTWLLLPAEDAGASAYYRIVSLPDTE
ncbi:TIGR03790 family protein [Halochromatium glycolicum]|uniref:TIGR03790 family protein n=1 Tax=Halochromatium glycolicum TaxID=85075 RepID=UPI001F5B6CDE|nr:TIGR03790 family protein [Halochromatium glycolicum]